MPPADNMPDFDSMSPDELMRWMESLAKRQGVDPEQLLTSADDDIAEIDPDSVVIDEPGYVPYGQDPKTYVPPPPRPRPAKVEPKPAAAAPAPPPPAKPEPTPEPKPEPVRQPEPEPELPLWQNVAPEPEPADEDAFSGIVSDNSMAWLESLAADQGGDFPSFDLSGLADDIEPLEPEAVSTVDPMAWLTNIADSQGEDINSEELNLGALVADEDEDDEDEEEVAAVGAELELEGEPGDPFGTGVDPMAWLETLAKRQGVPSEELLTSADLDIPLPREVFDDSPGYSDYSFDAEPEALSFAVIEDDEEEEDEDELVYEPADEFDPSQLEDPSAWLDALAEAQGYDEDAIIIDDEDELDSEAFAPISESVLIIEDDEELEDEDEDEDELEELGAPTDTDMQSALRTGEDISPDTMKAWLDAQMDRGFDRTDVTDEILDDEEEEDVFDLEEDELVPADLPDWLLDQVGRPANDSVEEERPKPTAELPALFDQIEEAQSMATADMPDWLRDDSDEAHPDLESIFALTEDEPTTAKVGEEPAAVVEVATPGTTPQPEYVLEVDTDDPWVEAFDEEHDHGMPDIAEMPDWYKRNLEDPDRIEAVQRLERGEEPLPEEAVELEEAVLAPESELPLGQPTDVPDWLVALDEEGEAEPELAMADLSELGIAIDSGDMPDWLAAADVELEPEDIPDWLIETMGTGEEEAITPAPEEEKISVVTAASIKPIPTVVPDTAKTLVPAAYVPPAYSPAPIPAGALNIDVAATLEQARAASSSGDLDNSLQNYELLIRANAQLEDAVDDLSKLSRQHNTNPALYRVLGDGLMRQGKLQQALDTYREALNQL